MYLLWYVKNRSDMPETIQRQKRVDLGRLKEEGRRILGSERE
jgi:hypothetical protein